MGTVLTPGDLPPWAQVPFFNPPKQTVYTGTGGVLTIAQGNPLRTVLLISNNSTGVQFVTMDPTVLATQGISIGTSLGSLILTAKDHGPLVTYPWYWVSVSLAFITVLEVTANRWPQQDGLQSDGSYHDAQALPYAVDPSDYDGSGANGYHYRALQSAASRLIRRG